MHARSVLVLALAALADHAALARADGARMMLPVARADARNRARFAAGEDPIPSRSSWPTTAPKDRAPRLALGEQAFSAFPVGVDDSWALRIDDEAGLRAAGVSIVDGDAIGLVFVEQGGRWRTAYTCALCHAQARTDGTLRVGPANAALRYGELLAAAYPDHPEGPTWRSWGAGRVDVTDDGIDNALRIPDLVGLDSARFLQASGAVVAPSPAGLARRIREVLTRSPVGGKAAPALAVALADWLRSLPGPRPPDRGLAGAPLFDAHCARCHDGPALGGRRRIAATVVGTNPRAARDALRGTGSYRVPPLLGAGDRARFFHDGAVEALGAVLDPRRLDSIPGHSFGLELAPADREAIIALLASSRW